MGNNRRLRASVLVVLLATALLPGVAPGAKGSTVVSESMAPTPSPYCGVLQTLDAVDANGRPLCTHGDDSFTLAPSSTGAAVSIPSTTAAPCFESPDTYRIEVLYGVPSDRQSFFERRLPEIRAGIALADAGFADSSGGTQHLKWLCHNNEVAVTEVALKPVGEDGVFTFNDVLESLRGPAARAGGPTKAPLRTHDNKQYARSDRVYLVFVEAPEWPSAGQATLDVDSSDSDSNANNTGPAYSAVRLFNSAGLPIPGPLVFNSVYAQIAPHELGHSLGAVQPDAPHNAFGSHCSDEYDIMCTGPIVEGNTTPPCPSYTNKYRWECGTRVNPLYHNGDDYYSVAPPPGSYIDTHWNLACSRWVLNAIPC